MIFQIFQYDSINNGWIFIANWTGTITAAQAYIQSLADTDGAVYQAQYGQDSGCTILQST